MKKNRFMESRREDWKRFEALLRKTEDRFGTGFGGEEVSEFSRLFRAVCYDLATVRSRDWGQDLENYLNDLVARGHNSFYRSPPGRPREVLRFLSSGFPRLLRQNVGYFWVALALFCVPGLIAGVLVYNQPELANRVLPSDMLVMFEQMYSGDRSSEEGEDRFGTGSSAAMTGFYVHNNIGIAFRCFATGIFLGIGTVFFLIYNSIFMGTIFAYLIVNGHGDRLLSFVVAHGAFELTAIVVSGAGGLIIGHALVRPGSYSRADALRRRGLVGVKLAAGAGAMLGVAALIEGFWSPLPLPSGLKYSVGGLMWVLVVVYLALAGRREVHSP